jgi:hypothetical protein
MSGVADGAQRCLKGVQWKQQEMESLKTDLITSVIGQKWRPGTVNTGTWSNKE